MIVDRLPNRHCIGEHIGFTLSVVRCWNARVVGQH